MAELTIHGVNIIEIKTDRQKNHDCDVVKILFKKNGSKINEVTVFAENGKQIKIEEVQGSYY